MTHKLILKVKTFQLSGAKRFGTVEEKPPGGVDPPPIPFRVNGQGLDLRLKQFQNDSAKNKMAP